MACNGVQYNIHLPANPYEWSPLSKRYNEEIVDGSHHRGHDIYENLQYQQTTATPRYTEMTTSTAMRYGEGSHQRYPKRLGIIRGEFTEQPPADQRKTNYFHFTMKLLYEQWPVKILQAKFVKFVDDCSPLENQNGMQYYFECYVPHATEDFENSFRVTLQIWMVDSRTNHIIQFEGKERSPTLDRVLLNHSVDCGRCLKKRSCGDALNRPDNPEIINDYEFRFHLKCQQNCLRTSGNPRETRLFKISMNNISPDGQRSMLAMSKDIFVHNKSSRHGRKRKRSSDDEGMPVITHVIPRSGTVGCPLAIAGKNLDTECQIFLSDCHIPTKLITDSLIEATVPDLGRTDCEITLSVRKEGQSTHRSNRTFQYVYPEGFVPLKNMYIPPGVFHTMNTQPIPSQGTTTYYPLTPP